MNSIGNISFIFVFAILGITVLFLFVFLGPALQTYTVRVFAIAEPILEDANAAAQEINDPLVRSGIQSSLQSSKDTTNLQVEVLGFLYQYAWAFVLVFSAIVLTILSRYLVERQVGAGAV